MFKKNLVKTLLHKIVFLCTADDSFLTWKLKQIRFSVKILKKG